MTRDARAVRLFCPALLTDGGIASYARMIVDALSPSPLRCYDLGTERPRHLLPATATVTRIAQRAPFALASMAEYLKSSAELVLAHVGLATPLAAVPHRSSGRVTVLAHGREVWQRLLPMRAAGLRRVDRFVFTTVFTRDQFLECNGDRLRPDVELDIVPLAAGREAEGPLRPRPASDRRRVVCVSRLTPNEPLKGIATLLEAAHFLPDSWEIRIVGDGEGRRMFEALAARLGVTARVAFTGRVTEAQKRAELDQAALLCLPSAQEGFGIVLLEALAAGRPCVGAAAGAIPEVLAPEVSELFPYGDARALAQAIERIGARLDAGGLAPEALRRHYDERYAFALFTSRWRALLGVSR